jgi:hypothetical protein
MNVRIPAVEFFFSGWICAIRKHQKIVSGHDLLRKKYLPPDWDRNRPASNKAWKSKEFCPKLEFAPDTTAQ